MRLESAISLYSVGLQVDGCLLVGFVDKAFRGLDGWRAEIATHQLTMRKVIASDGWPAWLELDSHTLQSRLQENTEQVRGEHSGKLKGQRDPHCCVLCHATRPTLWIHRGVCFECDERSRTAGKCPFALHSAQIFSAFSC